MDLTPYFSASECSPADVIAYAVRNLLAADETIQAIFGPERIEVCELLSGHDFRDMPRLQVSATAPAEQQGVGNVDIANPLAVYIRVRYEAPLWSTLVSGGASKLVWPFAVPTVETLCHHVLKVLKADKYLRCYMPNGNREQLAYEVAYSVTDAQPDVNAQGQVLFNRIIQASYRVQTVHDGADAGKIHNVAANGG